MTPLLTALHTALFTWHFEPYGTGGAVACFPPGGPDALSYGQLTALAPITGVCGPFYVVTGLRQPSDEARPTSKCLGLAPASGAGHPGEFPGGDGKPSMKGEL